MRCCTCSKLVHLRRSFLSYSRFKTLAALTLGAVLPASTLFLLEVSHLLALSSSLSSSSLYTSTVQSGTSGPPLPTQRSRIHSSKPLTLLPPTSYLRTSPPPHASCCLPILPAPSTDLLRVLQWNARGLRARSSELLHFISFHSVDLICIQESNLSSSSSFRILDTLRSDRTHCWSGILSPDDPHASGGVIIFVRQGLSFSELSTSLHHE